MAIGVMKARKHFGVEFPDLYAKETNPNKAAFDAVQRGHQNVLENIPIFLAVQAFVALAAGPLVAAGLITVYTVAKVGGGGGRSSSFSVFFLFCGVSMAFLPKDEKRKKLTLSLEQQQQKKKKKKKSSGDIL